MQHTWPSVRVPPSSLNSAATGRRNNGKENGAYHVSKGLGFDNGKRIWKLLYEL